MAARSRQCCSISQCLSNRATAFESPILSESRRWRHASIRAVCWAARTLTGCWKDQPLPLTGKCQSKTASLTAAVATAQFQLPSPSYDPLPSGSIIGSTVLKYTTRLLSPIPGAAPSRPAPTPGAAPSRPAPTPSALLTPRRSLPPSRPRGTSTFQVWPPIRPRPRRRRLRSLGTTPIPAGCRC